MTIGQNPGRKSNETIPFTPEGQKIKDKTARLRSGLPQQWGKIFFRIQAQGNYLKGKYPDFNRYELYHALVGSNLFADPGYSFYTQEDFPGDDSIEKFLNDLITEYLG